MKGTEVNRELFVAFEEIFKDAAERLHVLAVDTGRIGPLYKEKERKNLRIRALMSRS